MLNEGSGKRATVRYDLRTPYQKERDFWKESGPYSVERYLTLLTGRLEDEKEEIRKNVRREVHETGGLPNREEMDLVEEKTRIQLNLISIIGNLHCLLGPASPNLTRTQLTGLKTRLIQIAKKESSVPPKLGEEVPNSLPLNEHVYTDLLPIVTYLQNCVIIEQNQQLLHARPQGMPQKIADTTREQAKESLGGATDLT